MSEASATETMTESSGALVPVAVCKKRRVPVVSALALPPKALTRKGET